MNEALVRELRLRLQLGGDGSRDDLLLSLLEEAESMVCSYLNRQTMPPACKKALVRLAVALYNRIGMEGASSHNEGGVSVTVDPMPEDVRVMLRPYRIVRTVSVDG